MAHCSTAPQYTVLVSAIPLHLCVIYFKHHHHHNHHHNHHHHHHHHQQQQQRQQQQRWKLNAFFVNFIIIIIIIIIIVVVVVFIITVIVVVVITLSINSNSSSNSPVVHCPRLPDSAVVTASWSTSRGCCARAVPLQLFTTFVSSQSSSPDA